MDTNISQEGFPTLDEYQEKPEQLAFVDFAEYTGKAVVSAEGYKEQLKTATEMLKEAVHNNAAYHERDAKIKEAQKQQKQLENNIKMTEGVAPLVQKVKDLKSELKEAKESASSFAIEMMRRQNVNEFEYNGETFEIKPTAKIVKRK
jgi:predicted nuclease with TOPRIM domain